MVFLRLSTLLTLTVVVILTNANVVDKRLGQKRLTDQVDMREGEIGRVYNDELTSDAMIHYVYPIQDLSKFLS